MSAPGTDGASGGSPALLDGGATGDPSDAKQAMGAAAAAGDAQLHEGEDADASSDAADLGGESTQPETSSAGRGAGAGSEGGATSQG